MEGISTENICNATNMKLTPGAPKLENKEGSLIGEKIRKRGKCGLISFLIKMQQREVNLVLEHFVALLTCA